MHVRRTPIPSNVHEAPVPCQAMSSCRITIIIVKSFLLCRVFSFTLSLSIISRLLWTFDVSFSIWSVFFYTSWILCSQYRRKTACRVQFHHRVWGSHFRHRRRWSFLLSARSDNIIPQGEGKSHHCTETSRRLTESLSDAVKGNANQLGHNISKRRCIKSIDG